jgi:zinc transport system permease protein
MTVLLQMLAFPFMQRALLAGAILAVLLAVLGVFVAVRRMAFFGDGIAHSSLAGIAIAVLMGWSPLPVALAWAVLVALTIRRLERSTRLPSDALIGIFFTASLALGVALMSFSRGYQPELVSFLFGSILAVSPLDLVVMTGLSVVILAWLLSNFRRLTFMSLSEDAARVSGVSVEAQTSLLYVALALATVLGVRVLGAVMVSALLIIPAATARLLTHSFRAFSFVAAGVSLGAVLVGLVASYLLNLPAGAAVVLVAAGVFFITAVTRLSRS